MEGATKIATQTVHNAADRNAILTGAVTMTTRTKNRPDIVMIAVIASVPVVVSIHRPTTMIAATNPTMAARGEATTAAEEEETIVAEAEDTTETVMTAVVARAMIDVADTTLTATIDMTDETNMAAAVAVDRVSTMTDEIVGMEEEAGDMTKTTDMIGIDDVVDETDEIAAKIGRRKRPSCLLLMLYRSSARRAQNMQKNG